MLDIVEDVPRVLAAIVSAVAAGELPLEDAADLSKLVEGVIKAKCSARRLMPLKIDEMTEEQLEQFLVSNGVALTVPVDTNTESEYGSEQDHFTVPGEFPTS